MLNVDEGVIRRGVGAGLKFRAGPANTSYLLGTYEPAVQECLETILRPGMTIFDIGANVGFLSVLTARLVGELGRVISFEPVPSNAALIGENAEANSFTNVQVMQLAVGSTDARADFVPSEKPCQGKLHSDAISAAGANLISVEMRRLDSLVLGGELPAPDVVKIDTEGNEADVIAGAGEVLEMFRPVLLIELHGTNAEIGASLRHRRYRSFVLGSDDQVEAAPPYAYVVAAPSEQQETVARIRAAAQAAETMR